MQVEIKLAGKCLPAIVAHEISFFQMHDPEVGFHVPFAFEEKVAVFVRALPDVEALTVDIVLDPQVGGQIEQVSGQVVAQVAVELFGLVDVVPMLSHDPQRFHDTAASPRFLIPPFPCRFSVSHFYFMVA